MTLIEVEPIIVNANGEEDLFGDEPGTPQYYMVKETIEKYLGEENVWVHWDYVMFTYKIEVNDEDEGCDMTYDYIDLIVNIYESFPDTFYKGHHLKFQIVNI